MLDNKHIKSFNVPKRLNTEAKIIGLNYTTFFVFVIAAAVIFMVSSSGGFIGIGIGIAIIFSIYMFFYFIQTKLSKRDLEKKKHDYFHPITHIKVKASFQRSVSFLKKIKANEL